MTIFEMSAGGAVLIAVILVLRQLLLYRLPKWTFLLLWTATLCRLLIPFAIPSPVSVYTGAAWVVQTLEPEETPPEQELPVILPPVTYPGTFQADGWTPSAAPVLPNHSQPQPELLSLVDAVYLAGAALCALFFIAVYSRGLWRFRDAVPVESDFLTRWQAAHPASFPVRIKACAAVNAPLAYGLLRPVVLLPESTDWSDEDQLNYILTHEYVHIRRGDLFWKLLLTTALCLHWFNPLVWAMYFRANQDLELACDETVVRILGLDRRKEYAYSLLAAAESGFSPLCLTYTTKNHMEERIRAIMKIKKQSLAAILTAALLVTGVTAVFATSKAPKTVDIGNLPSAVHSDPPPKNVSAPVQKPVPPGQPDENKPGDTSAVSSENLDYAVFPKGDATGSVTEPQSPLEPTQTGLENRWGVPGGEIPQWTEFTVDSFEDAHELGKYLETVHGLYPGDYTPGWVDSGSYIVQVTYMERAVRQRLPDGRYPVNSKGETYGTDFDSQVVGCKPDLILAVATNGAEGYIVGRDSLFAGYPGEVNNPSDAMAYMAWLETQPNIILIPVYDVNRDNVIGYYRISNGSGIITPEEELSMVEDQLRNNMGLSEEEITRELEKLKETKGWS